MQATTKRKAIPPHKMQRSLIDLSADFIPPVGVVSLDLNSLVLYSSCCTIFFISTFKPSTFQQLNSQIVLFAHLDGHPHHFGDEQDEHTYKAVANHGAILNHPASVGENAVDNGQRNHCRAQNHEQQGAGLCEDALT